MTPSTCCFCNHQNPERAKFCNECASPLHLRPCTSCNAVNARASETCHRCGAALPGVATADAMPQRIVAEADATLATLKRELVATAAMEGGIAPLAMHDEGVARDAVASAPAPDVPDASVVVAPAEPRFTTSAATDAINATEVAPAVLPGEREWRPERRSRGLAYAAVFALLVLPVAVYVVRNPAQVDAWLERLAGPPAPIESSSERAAATVSPPPPLPAAQLPAAGTTGTQPAQDATGEQARTEAMQEAPKDATNDASKAPAPSAEGAAPAAPPPVAAVAPASPAKAASKSASRTSASKARPRERPKARSQPAPTQSSSGASEPCTEAMAALGLCSR